MPIYIDIFPRWCVVRMKRDLDTNTYLNVSCNGTVFTQLKIYIIWGTLKYAKYIGIFPRCCVLRSSHKTWSWHKKKVQWHEYLVFRVWEEIQFICERKLPCPFEWRFDFKCNVQKLEDLTRLASLNL